MTGFYATQVKILRPQEVTASHGRSTTLTYDLDTGAQLIDVTFGVELQPKTRVELDDQARVATQSGYRLHTPPGRDLDLRPDDRIRCAIGDLDIVGEVDRWPSTEHPSGVDHVEVNLELRTG